MPFGPESVKARMNLRDLLRMFREKQRELKRTTGREQQETPQLEENAVSNQTHELDETT